MDSEGDGFYIDSDTASTTSSLIDFFEPEDEQTVVGGMYINMIGDLLDLSQQ